MSRLLTFERGHEPLSRLLTFKRARTYAAVLLLLFVVAWVYELRSGTPPLYGDNVPIGGDYIAFHAAGRLLVTGHANEMYDRSAVVAVQDSLLDERVSGFYDGFRNPPFFALPFAPLAIFDLVPGFGLWSLVSLTCLGLSFRLFLRSEPELSTRWRGLLVLMFAFAPVYFGLIDGENSMLSLLLFVGLFVALRRRQFVLVGVLAALGLFKPQLFVVFPVALLALRSWRGLAAYLVTALGLTAVSFAMVGASGMAAWLRIVVEPEAGQVVVNTWRMVSLKSLLDGLLPGLPLVALALYALGALLLVGLVYWCWSASRTPFALAWIVTSLAAVLVDPHLVDYDLAVLVPAGVLAVRDVPGVRWLLVPLYLLLIARAALPIGDSTIQLSTLVLIGCLALTWNRIHAFRPLKPLARSRVSDTSVYSV